VTFNAGAAYPARPRPHASIAVINSTNLVEALITADSDVDLPLGSVILSATDETAFTSDVVAVSVAGAFAGGSSIALSISFALATTDLGGTVSTQINDSDVDAGVDIWLTSLANGTVSGDGVGVALSLSAAAGSHLSGGRRGRHLSPTRSPGRRRGDQRQQRRRRPGRDRGQRLLLTATDSIHSTADASRPPFRFPPATRPAPWRSSAARATNASVGQHARPGQEQQVAGDRAATSASPRIRRANCSPRRRPMRLGAGSRNSAAPRRVPARKAGIHVHAHHRGLHPRRHRTYGRSPAF